MDNSKSSYGRVIIVHADCKKLRIKRRFPLVVADPPYGGILSADWDRITEQQATSGYMAVARKCARSWLEPGGSAYIWGGIGKRKHRAFLRFFVEVEHEWPELYLQDLITWKKRRGYGKKNGYLFTREECAFLTLGKKPAVFNKPYLKELRTCRSFNPKYPAKSPYLRRANVWLDITEVFGKKRADAQKPLRLAEVMIETHTARGQWVLDPFAGSGSTGIAAAQLGRNAVLIEKSLACCREMADYFKVATRIPYRCINFDGGSRERVEREVKND